MIVDVTTDGAAVTRDDAVFRALAEPNRRLLLDALRRDDGQSLAALCAVLPRLTRFGVAKHLAVLEAAGLVNTHRHGRHKLHYLDPTPIQRVHERWISSYALPTVVALTELERRFADD